MTIGSQTSQVSTPEALAIRVDRTCTAEGIVAIIEDLVFLAAGQNEAPARRVIRHLVSGDDPESLVRDGTDAT